MSEMQRLNQHLQKTIDCIDRLEEGIAISEEEIAILKRNLTLFASKLKTKKLNIGTTNSVGFIDNNSLTGIMNQMIEYAELNFTNQLQISGDDDIMNTIATTVNLLGEELEDKIKKLQELNIVLEVTTETNKIKSQELHGIMSALENSALIFIISTKGSIVKVNQSFCKISKYEEFELLNKDFKILKSNYHTEIEVNDMLKTVYDKKTWRGEIKCLAKDKSEYWIDIVINPITDINGGITHFLCIGNSITEKKHQESLLIESEKAMRKSLAEKEILLQEVNHRVKNNLQMISSLMQLQINRTKNKEVTSLLSDSQKRIYAMSLMHEKLYKSENISEINISEYTNNFITSFVNMYGNSSDFIVKLKVNIQDNIIIDMSRAIHFGLIFNEIISNCYKHAFKKGKEALLEITLLERRNKIYLVVKDSGKGLNDNIDIKNLNTLGLKLINSLSLKLKAEVFFENKNGLEVSVNFKK